MAYNPAPPAPYDPTDTTNLEGLAPVNEPAPPAGPFKYSGDVASLSDPAAIKDIGSARAWLAAPSQGTGGGTPQAPAKQPQSWSQFVLDTAKHTLVPTTGVQDALESLSDAATLPTSKAPEATRVPMFTPDDVKQFDAEVARSRTDPSYVPQLPAPIYVPADNAAAARTQGKYELAQAFEKDGQTKWSPISRVQGNESAYTDNGYKPAANTSPTTAFLSRLMPGASFDTLDVVSPATSALNDWLGAPAGTSYYDLYTQRRQEQEALNIQRKQLDPKSYAGGEMVGGALTSLPLGEGGAVAQALKFGGAGAAQSGSESIARGDSPGTVAENAGIGFGTGAAVPAAFGALGVAKNAIVGGPITETGLKQQMADQLIRSEMQKDGSLTYQEAASRLGIKINEGSDSNVPGVERTLATAVPDNATIAKAQNSLEAKRGTPAADQLAERNRANQTAIVEHVHSLGPTDAAIAAKEDALASEAETKYNAARESYEAKTDPEVQKQHAIQVAGLAEGNADARDALMKAEASIRDEEGLAAVAKARADQATAETGQQVEPTFKLRPGTGSPVDELHRARMYIDQTIAENPASRQDNLQRIFARGQIDDQIAHMSPDFKAADAYFAPKKAEIAQMKAAQTVSQDTAPSYTQHIQQRALGNAVENATITKGPNKGQSALAPDVEQQFNNAIDELGRQQQAASLGNGPGSATAGRVGEMVKNAVGGTTPAAYVGATVGGVVGHPAEGAAMATAAKNIISTLRSYNEQRAAANFYLNPRSTGELFLKLSQPEKANVLGVMNTIKSIRQSAIRAGTPSVDQNGWDTSGARAVGGALLSPRDELEGLWDDAMSHAK